VVGSCWIEDLPFVVDTTLTFVVVDEEEEAVAVDSRKEKY
jgi:hypothetical protein